MEGGPEYIMVLLCLWAESFGAFFYSGTQMLSFVIGCAVVECGGFGYAGSTVKDTLYCFKVTMLV